MNESLRRRRVLITAAAAVLTTGLVGPATPAAAGPAPGPAAHPALAGAALPADSYLLTPEGLVHLRDDVTVTVTGADGAALEVSPAQLVDATMIAAAEGREVAEVAAELIWQDEFGRIATTLEEQLPDELSGARRSAEPGGLAWIAFKGAVPDLAHRLAAGSSRPVMLVPDRGFALAELVEAQIAMFDQLARDGTVADATSWVDEATGRIVVEVQLAGSVTGAAEAELRTALHGYAVDLPGTSVEIRTVDRVDPVELENVRGGGWFRRTRNSDTGRCTTGFTVRDSANTSRRGVATAGHCTGTDRFYANHNSSSWSQHGRVAGHVGSGGDIAWYRVNSPLAIGHFYSGWGATRTVAGSAAPRVNDRLCKFGTTTGAGCATVLETNRCFFTSVGEVCRQARTGSINSAGGDSGGPWYSGNTAYGIHTGSNGSSAIFTPVGRLSNHFGVVVIRA